MSCPALPGLRCPVAVALSEDGGKTFPLIRNMERGAGHYNPTAAQVK